MKTQTNLISSNLENINSGDTNTVSYRGIIYNLSKEKFNHLKNELIPNLNSTGLLKWLKINQIK